MLTRRVASENCYQEDSKSALLLKISWAQQNSPFGKGEDQKPALPSREDENSKAGRNLIQCVAQLHQTV